MASSSSVRVTGPPTPAFEQDGGAPHAHRIEAHLYAIYRGLTRRKFRFAFRVPANVHVRAGIPFVGDMTRWVSRRNTQGPSSHCLQRDLGALRQCDRRWSAFGQHGSNPAGRRRDLECALRRSSAPPRLLCRLEAKRSSSTTRAAVTRQLRPASRTNAYLYRPSKPLGVDVANFRCAVPDHPRRALTR